MNVKLKRITLQTKNKNVRFGGLCSIAPKKGENGKKDKKRLD